MACEVLWCQEPVTTGTYCERHNRQIKVLGKIVTTKQDRNAIIYRTDYAEMLLLDKAANICGYAKIDLADVERVKQCAWSKATKGYVYCNKLKVYLHVFLLGKKDGLQIDHINRDRLDNRKSNLRRVTQGQNSRNSKIHIDNRSGYKGVHFDEGTNKFRSRIYVDGKSIHLGVFHNAKDAALAYDDAARKHYGQYSNTNF